MKYKLYSQCLTAEDHLRLIYPSTTLLTLYVVTNIDTMMVKRVTLYVITNIDTMMVKRVTLYVITNIDTMMVKAENAEVSQARIVHICCLC